MAGQQIETVRTPLGVPTLTFSDVQDRYACLAVHPLGAQRCLGSSDVRWQRRACARQLTTTEKIAIGSDKAMPCSRAAGDAKQWPQQDNLPSKTGL